jgi:hypothetical protein
MTAEVARQWVVSNWRNAPAGFEVNYRCSSCSKKVTIRDNLYLALPAVMLAGCLFMLWLAACGLA